MTATPIRTFYVDGTSGNDANSGTSQNSAWKTIAKANNMVKAGDFVFFSGAFTNDSIAPKVSGAPGTPIYYKGIGSPRPLLTITNNLAAIQLSGRSYIIVENFDIDQLGSGDAIYMFGSTFNWIRNIRLSGGVSRMFTGSTDNRIEDSQISTTKNPMMYIKDNFSRNLFARNVISGGGSAGISLGMGDVNAPASKDNVFVANDMSNNTGTIIELSGSTQNTMVYCNKIHDAGTSLSSSFQNGNTSQPQGGGGSAIQIASSSNQIMYNQIYNNKWEILRLQALGNCTPGTKVSNASSNIIQHNVIYGNGGANIRIMNSGTATATCANPNWADTKNNSIENNIFWNNSQFCDFHYCNVSANLVYAVVIGLYHTGLNTWPSGATGLNGNLIRNNFMGRQTSNIGKTWLFWEGYTSAGSRGYSFVQAEAQFPNEIMSNSENDPMLIDPANRNFYPGLGSPVFNFGRILPGLPYNGLAPEPGIYEN